MRVPSLVKIDKRLIDFAVFLCQRNFMSGNVVGRLEVAARTLEFLKMVGDVFGGDEFVAENGTQQFSL